jgi:DNA-binding CsgD family transcriptional regulator
MPGTASRGSVHERGHGGLSPLGRRIVDGLDRGVILLGKNGKVLDSNVLARGVLAGGNGLLLRGGRLAFVDAGLDQRFAQMLADRDNGDGSRALAASVKRVDAPSCRVLVSPVELEDGDARGVEFVVFIYRAAESRDIAPDVLRDIYGLTRAQTDVARKLYAGLSIEQTAAELGLSANTVRTHLKQIFFKCEVQSQAELLHSLALGPQAI